jgi:cell division protein FtsZ
MNDASIRFIAVGHAGAQILSALRARSGSTLECAHADTSPESLRISLIDRKITLGISVSHGLGAGGDPEIGRLSAESDLSSIHEFTQGARLVFVITGLGGGTGSGAAPVIARAARESGALVLVIATTPFDFERRRLLYAQEALDRLRVSADAVLAISNQRVRRMHDDRTHPHELYQFANELLAQTLQGLCRLLNAPGLIPLDFAHIERLLRGRHAESAFAAVQATGENRAHAAAEQLLTHPFLDTGSALASAKEILVSVAGGDDLQIGEVERLIEALQGRCPTAEFIVGASIDPALTGHIHVTAITTRPAASAPNPLVGSGFARNAAAPTSTGNEAGMQRGVPIVFNGEDFNREPEPRATTDSRFIPPPPELTIDQRQRILSGQRNKPSRRRPDSQMIMNFDIAQRGRFDNTERNRHKGVDLDVPTYLRLGIVLN